MTDHAASHEALEHHDDHSGHDSPEAIRAEKRKYLIVLGVLAALTILTVTVSRMHFPHPVAIAIGLFIATVKASLVGMFFMHLISERKLIYAVLGLTVFFFAVLLWGPWHHVYEAVEHSHEVGVISTEKAPAQQPASSPGGH